MQGMSQDEINQLLSGEKQSLEKIYQNHFPQILNLVTRNSGTEEDAKDVFQEALLVVYKQASSQSLKLSCSLGTYLYAVSRNIWLLRLKRMGKVTRYIEPPSDFEDTSLDTLETMHANEKYFLYQKHFKMLNEGCQKVLKLFFDGEPMEVIAEKLGFKSGRYARKKKFKCKEKLIENIKNDALYNDLMGNIPQANEIKE